MKTIALALSLGGLLMGAEVPQTLPALSLTACVVLSTK